LGLPLACQNAYTVVPAGISSATSTYTHTPVPSGFTPTATNTTGSGGSGTATNTPTSTSTLNATNSPTWTATTSGTISVNYGCNSDTASGVTVVRTINPARSFVPLCNGVILYGDRENAQIVEYNVITNSVLQTFPVQGTPGELSMDSTNGYLYCTLDGADKIDRLNLNNGVVTGITTTDVGDYLYASGNGLVFVCQGVWSSQTLTILNGPAASVLNTVSIPAVGFPVFDSGTNTLYFGVYSFSPSALYSYSYNTSSYTITQSGYNWDPGSNGEDLALSPDGNHLAFPEGSGNNGYIIYDYSPTSITTSNGSWSTGAYPSSAGFSPDSQHVVATDGSDVFVFSTFNYTTSKTWSSIASGFPYVRTRFSQGGDYVFMLMGNTSSTTAPASIFCSSFP